MELSKRTMKTFIIAVWKACCPQVHRHCLEHSLPLGRMRCFPHPNAKIRTKNQTPNKNKRKIREKAKFFRNAFVPCRRKQGKCDVNILLSRNLW